MIRLMLIDRYQQYAEAIGNLLLNEKELSIIQTFSSGSDALGYLRTPEAEKPDIVILDADLGGKEPVGLSYAVYIDQHFSDIKVLVMSVQKVAWYPYQMYLNGIPGFLFKDCRSQEILKAIFTLSRGENYYQPEAQKMVERYRDYQTLPPDDQPFLTATEKDILRWKSHGHEDKAVAEKMRMPDENLLMHLKNIFRKFGTSDIWDIIVNAFNRGLFHDDHFKPELCWKRI